MAKDANLPLSEIAGRIFVVRGKRVMLDSDLALIYGVPVPRRFPILSYDSRGYAFDIANCDIKSRPRRAANHPTGVY
jgi:hypothetical protein